MKDTRTKFIMEAEKFLSDHNKAHKDFQKYAQRAKATLLKKSREYNFHAEFAAQICNELGDSRNHLCMEWMLEYYMAMQFEKVYPWIKNIQKYLLEHGHGERNKFEYFNDCEAYLVDRERLIFVCGTIWNDKPRYIIIDDPPSIEGFLHHTCYVRHIWRKAKVYKGAGFINVEHPTLRHYRTINFDMHSSDERFSVYGDCRDHGHVLTYENLLKKRKCDHVHWHLEDAKAFLFEVNTLWTQMKEMG